MHLQYMLSMSYGAPSRFQTPSLGISMDVSEMIQVKWVNEQLQNIVRNVKYIQNKKLPLICGNCR